MTQKAPHPSYLEQFAQLRAPLLGLAYRMTGSQSEAEDLLQEAFVKWHAVDHDRVDNPRAFLARLVTHLCLDHLKSARVRRESYVGPWLPEPVLDAERLAADALTEYAHDITLALMLALERLSPLERAAFLLHDVFDLGYREVAETLGRDPAACRKLAERGRERVREARPRRVDSPPNAGRILAAFQAALANGNVEELKLALADDVVFYGDGGGRVTAARKPILGPDRVARFLVGITKKYRVADLEQRPALVNGLWGAVIERAGRPVQTVAFEFAGERIVRIYSVRNPDKLTHLTAESGKSTSA